MFESVRRRVTTVVAVSIAAALAVGGGVALAQSGPGSSAAHHRKTLSGKRMPPPGGPIGMFGPVGKDLTYAQLHVQNEGKEEAIRLDRGEVVSASESSITLKENDGSEVTVAVDGSTKVLAGPGTETAVGDLEAGQEVTVCGPEGGAAKAIMLPPKKGQAPGEGRMPPPPGM